MVFVLTRAEITVTSLYTSVQKCRGWAMWGWCIKSWLRPGSTNSHSSSQSSHHLKPQRCWGGLTVRLWVAPLSEPSTGWPQGPACHGQCCFLRLWQPGSGCFAKLGVTVGGIMPSSPRLHSFCPLVHVSGQFGWNVPVCVGSNLNILIIVSLNVALHFKITITRLSLIHLLKKCCSWIASTSRKLLWGSWNKKTHRR